MCGIVGIISLNQKVSENALKSMTSAIRHRGPDAAGIKIWSTDNYSLGLGHVRLSIIDLSSNADQPMVSEELGLSISYNGEIYNFSEIKQELLRKGYQFRSNSDTEVILAAYHQWGQDCLLKFNGMFAFAIYDMRLGKLVLCRDRAGVKPLYYYFKDNIFLFGSEIKAFHQHPQFKKELSNDAVAAFLKLGFIPSPNTIFNNCHKLDAGNILIYDLLSNSFELRKYWQINTFFNHPKNQGSEESILADIESLLVSSFKYRMVSDVPVGIFLSGGYDSSTVAAVLQANSSTPINTFSIGFNESSFNEAPYAKEIAKHIGSQHNEFYCSISDARELVSMIPKVYDEPFGDSSAIPTLLLSKMASNKVKVVLSGDGGDELFCGYGKYYNNFTEFNKIAELNGVKKDILKNLIKLLIRSGVTDKLPDLLAHKILKAKNVLSAKSYTNKLRFKIEPYHVNDIELEKILKKSFSPLPSSYDNIDHLSTNCSSIDVLMAIDFQTNLIDDLLVKVDRASMAFGLEVREPLLDFRLIEYMAKLPSSVKFTNNVPKYLMRKITHRYIPEKLMDRPKMGFAIPKEKWMREDLSSLVKEVILDSQARSSVFNKVQLEEYVNRFFRKRNLEAEKIWNLFMFQYWYNVWM